MMSLIYPCHSSCNEKLNVNLYDYRKEYLKVSLENPNGFNYQPGDHVAIFPINSERDVDIMCERLVDTDEATTANTPVTLVNQSNDWAVDIDMPTCSMRTALTYYLDISGPPHQNLLQRLVERGCVKDMSEEKDLTELATVSYHRKYCGNVSEGSLHSWPCCLFFRTNPCTTITLPQNGRHWSP